METFENQIKAVDESIAAKRERQKLRREQAKYQPGRLARARYPGDELPLQNAEAPKGSLRKVSISDTPTVLVDRFKSLQKR